MITDLIQKIPNSWKDILEKIPCEDIDHFLNEEAQKYKDLLDILPDKELIFKAFEKCNLEDIKVVIIGQDCYPTKGNPMGLCFSVPTGIRCPPSLRNIFKELENEYKIYRYNTDLTDWAEQGVLMLNTALTVRESCAGSHIKIWKNFTETIVKYIAENKENICWILWGAHAAGYSHYIDKSKNLVLIHSHPSPLSRQPFVGCDHFKKCNDYLESKNIKTIKWV